MILSERDLKRLPKVKTDYNVVCKKCTRYDGWVNVCNKHHIPTRGDDWGCSDFKKKRRKY